MARNTPDMTGKASDITDTEQLYARIGYRVYREWLQSGQVPDFVSGGPVRKGHATAELRRLRELNGE
jgi:hypothetical protein